MITILALFVGVIIGACLAEDKEDAKCLVILSLLGIIGLGLFALGRALA